MCQIKFEFAKDYKFDFFISKVLTHTVMPQSVLQMKFNFVKLYTNVRLRLQRRLYCPQLYLVLLAKLFLAVGMINH